MQRQQDNMTLTILCRTPDGRCKQGAGKHLLKEYQYLRPWNTPGLTPGYCSEMGVAVLSCCSTGGWALRAAGKYFCCTVCHYLCLKLVLSITYLLKNPHTTTYSLLKSIHYNTLMPETHNHTFTPETHTLSHTYSWNPHTITHLLLTPAHYHILTPEI